MTQVKRSSTQPRRRPRTGLPRRRPITIAGQFSRIRTWRKKYRHY
jgi:hypothetical protein